VAGATLTVDAAPVPLPVGSSLSVPAHLTTDALGLAMYSFTPDGRPFAVTAQAEDAQGHTARATLSLQDAPSEEALILRADKPLAKVGDTLTLAALSSVKGGTLYLDVIRNGQTILTRAADMAGGRAVLTLPVTDDMTGTVELHAYKILPNEDIIKDTRTVIVSPADDLTVRVAADQAEYKPGGDATLRFTVSGPSGAPVRAALGLAIVDESVFALSELQPGLEKVYFTLEKELMEPKYEVYGLSPAGLLLEGDPDQARQRAATLLLLSAPASDGFDWRVNTYDAKAQKVQEAAQAEMEKAAAQIVAALAKYEKGQKAPLTAGKSLTLLVTKGYLKPSALLDPWGHGYRTDLEGDPAYSGYFSLNSAGPDGVWGTGDDIRDVPVYPRVSFGRARVMPMIPAPMMVARPMMAAGAMEKHAAMDRVAVADASDVSVAAAPAPASAPAAPRVRSYFPETLYWNPGLLTDDAGHAEVRVPLADSITTWRLSMLASGLAGQMGSGTAPIRVFQDFFVDIDLPVALTQHDSVEVPVTVYNYLPSAQDVTLSLAPQPWFELRGPSDQTLSVGPGEVKVVYYPITVRQLGHFDLSVTARGTALSDAVRRTVDVLPDGQRQDAAVNGRLDGPVEKTLTIPGGSVPGASRLFVKLYPGAFSQLVEGLDGMLQMPSGCFEQTSSTTYPDVLALDYMKQTKKINPALQMKAEGYINAGYQRLVTFECKRGGFSWFGDEPAHQTLTAYGLLEFADMARVHSVDPALIARTQNWLAGIINRQTGALRTTAYVAWALAESGYDGAALARGVGYVRAHRGEAKDPYTLAVVLNLLARVDPSGEATAAVANRLIGEAKTTARAAYWAGEGETFTGASGAGVDGETTGLAAYALLRWGRDAGFTNKVLTRLVGSKDSAGTWGTTQATIWSLKALLYASRRAGSGGAGTLTVLAGGQAVQTVAVSEADSDVMRQIDLTPSLLPGANTVRLEWAGTGAPLYQIAARWYRPWARADRKPAAATGPLTIHVAYDKTLLLSGDVATVTATVKNVSGLTAEMPLIDLGVPPGFVVQPEALEAAVTGGTISKYTVAARQIIVYLEKLAPGRSVRLRYGLRAKYPIHAQSPESRAYPYYDPQRVAVSAPQAVTVRR